MIWNKGMKGWTNSGSFKKGHKDLVPLASRIKAGKKHKGKKHALGYHHTLLNKKKIGDAQKGCKSHLWKGGISKMHGYGRIFSARYKLRKKKVKGIHTFLEWEELKKIYNYSCPSCLKSEPKISLTEDHIMPISKGGSNYISNIQPLCRSCNSKKYNKTIKYDAPKSIIINNKLQSKT